MEEINKQNEIESTQEVISNKIEKTQETATSQAEETQETATSQAEETKEFATSQEEAQETSTSQNEQTQQNAFIQEETQVVGDVVYPYSNNNGKRKANLFTRFIKRSFDFTSSFLLFLTLNVTLIFPILTILVAIKMKGNPFFIQKRPGKNGKIFSLIKFRTMTNKKDENGKLLPDEQRMTKFGAMLRSTSLDELPELLNIIKGDMSVVGPRPQLARDMVFFSQDAMRRQSVRGGLTGLAQTSGRNNLLWEERFDYDLEYIDNYGFLYDLKIIFRTIKKVVKSDNIATEGMQTSEDYGDYLLRIGAVDRETYDQKQVEASAILANEKNRR